MHISGGGNQGIHCMYGPPLGLAARDHMAPLIGHRCIHRQNAVLESQRQIGAQPFVEMCTTFARRKRSMP